MRHPAVRFRVHFSPRGAVGPGKIELLEHIGSGGSLSQAARELGMSYRRAWQLLASLNSSFDERVALSVRGGSGGGGAQLTPFGCLLVRVYRDFDAELQRRAARSFARISAHARPTRSAAAAQAAGSVRRRAGRAWSRRGRV
jgi:molybdate transport system regulatory protein